MSQLNPNLDMPTPQGLSKKGLKYEAVVVQNDDTKRDDKDKRMLGRIQFRIDTIFDGIKDEHLPWAIPGGLMHSCGATSTSGSFTVPDIGSKVFIEFQEGHAQFPVYYPYTVDAKTSLREREYNYPKREVHLLSTTGLLIIDKKTNEVFIRNPGAARIYIQGDVDLFIEGNVLEKIKGNRITKIFGNVIEKVLGSKTVEVKGDLIHSVKGNRVDFVVKDSVNNVGGSYKHYVGGPSEDYVGVDRYKFTVGNNIDKSGGTATRAGSISDNPPGGVSAAPSGVPPQPPEITVPVMTFWPAVRGAKPDTAETKPLPLPDKPPV